MAISGFLFLSWRIFEIITLVPIVGMLGWFVAQFNNANALTPTYILVLFIVSVLALAWTFFTTINYLRARHDAMFVAMVDLGFVGALIGGVVVMRFIAKANCSSASFGLLIDGVPGNSYFNINVNKTCAMLKASFALAIIDILAFFVTFVSDRSAAAFLVSHLLTITLSSSLSSFIITTATTTVLSSSENTTAQGIATDAQGVGTTAAAAITTDPLEVVDEGARTAPVAGGNITFERTIGTSNEVMGIEHGVPG